MFEVLHVRTMAHERVRCIRTVEGVQQDQVVEFFRMQSCIVTGPLRIGGPSKKPDAFRACAFPNEVNGRVNVRGSFGRAHDGGIFVGGFAHGRWAS